jgi:hypothetical protein
VGISKRINEKVEIFISCRAAAHMQLHIERCKLIADEFDRVNLLRFDSFGVRTVYLCDYHKSGIRQNITTEEPG